MVLVEETHDISSHGGIRVFRMMGAASMVSGIEEPNVVGFSVPFAQCLPVVAASQEAMQNDQMPVHPGVEAWNGAGVEGQVGHDGTAVKVVVQGRPCIAQQLGPNPNTAHLKSERGLC